MLSLLDSRVFNFATFYELNDKVVVKVDDFSGNNLAKIIDINYLNTSAILYPDRSRGMDYRILFRDLYPLVAIHGDLISSKHLYFFQAVANIQKSSLSVVGVLQDVDVTKFADELVQLKTNLRYDVAIMPLFEFNNEPKLITYDEIAYCAIYPIRKLKLDHETFFHAFDVASWVLF